MKKPTVISFINYKGGVGKTNVSVNFAYYAAVEKKLSTLLIDWDPQGDATEYIGFGRDNVQKTMFEILLDSLPCTIGETIAETAYKNLYLIGANPTLKNVEKLVQSDDMFETFRETVHGCAQQFDIVVLDCPPANSGVNIASIFASTDVFVVTTPASDSIDKINLVNQMINSIGQAIEDNVEPELLPGISRPAMKGIVLTMGMENTLGLDVAREHMKNTWAEMVMDPMIPRAVSASYSVSEGAPVLKTKPQDKISLRYRELFKEVLRRVN